MQDVKTDRYKYIGGSDIPIIMGISPFKSRFDLLLEKAQLKDDNFEGNEYTEYGNVLEEKIRNYINASLGKDYKEGKHTNGDIRIHTDGENYDSILEIKTTSQIHDDVNDYTVYLVQLLFYMEQTGKHTGILAVYERPENFDEEFNPMRLREYMINIDNYKELIDKINTAVDMFREDLKKVKANPMITEEELLPVEVRSIAVRIEELEDKITKNKELEKELEDEKENLRVAMEKYSIKKWTTTNDMKMSYVEGKEPKTTIEKVFDEEKFKSENPELYEKYLVEKEKKTKGSKSYVKITLPRK